jgi:hypothetical protein
MYAETIKIAEMGEFTFIYTVSLGGEENFTLMLPSSDYKGIKIVDYDRHKAMIILQKSDKKDDPLIVFNVDFSNPEVFSIKVKQIERAEDLFSMGWGIAKEFMIGTSETKKEEVKEEREKKGEGDSLER